MPEPITLLPLPQWTQNERHFNQQDRDDIQAYARECVESDRKTQRAAVLEEAAAVVDALRDDHCKGTQTWPDTEGWCTYDNNACDFVCAWNDAARAIRALIDKEAT